MAVMPCSSASRTPAPSLHLCPQGLLAGISFKKLEHAENGVTKSCHNAQQCSVSFPSPLKCIPGGITTGILGMAFRAPVLHSLVL